MAKTNKTLEDILEKGKETLKYINDINNNIMDNVDSSNNGESSY